LKKNTKDIFTWSENNIRPVQRKHTASSTSFLIGVVSWKPSQIFYVGISIRKIRYAVFHPKGLYGKLCLEKILLLRMQRMIGMEKNHPPSREDSMASNSMRVSS
jgi:hypothetical protein